MAVIYSQVTPQLLQGAVEEQEQLPAPSSGSGIQNGFTFFGHFHRSFLSLGHSPEAAAPQLWGQNCPSCGPPPSQKTLTLLPIKILKNAVFKAGVGTSCKETEIAFEVGIMAVMQTQFLREMGIN